MAHQPVGRPRLIESPDAMLILAEQYFDECIVNNQPIRITGLALALGLSGREAFDKYGARPEYVDLVKRLKSFVADAYESRLSGNTPTGAIFALKNMGWSDQQQIKISGDPDNPITVNVVHIGSDV